MKASRSREGLVFRCEVPRRLRARDDPLENGAKARAASDHPELIRPASLIVLYFPRRIPDGDV
jgi:hypothetical protein